MTEGVQFKRVTALFAEGDAAIRRTMRLYADGSDTVELSSLVASGQDVIRELSSGLKPEVLVLDSLLGDTTIYALLRQIYQMQLGYSPRIIVALMPNTAQQAQKLLTLGATCIIFKPYDLPGLFDAVCQAAADGERLERYLVHESLTRQLRALGGRRDACGAAYLEYAVCLSIFEPAACTLGELCEKTGGAFGVSGSAVRAALERLNVQLYQNGTRAYRAFCAGCRKRADARLTVRELLNAVAARARHDLRR